MKKMLVITAAAAGVILLSGCKPEEAIDKVKEVVSDAKNKVEEILKREEKEDGVFSQLNPVERKAFDEFVEKCHEQKGELGRERSATKFSLFCTTPDGQVKEFVWAPSTAPNVTEEKPAESAPVEEEKPAGSEDVPSTQ